MADFPFTTSTINTTNSVSVGNSTVNATVNSTSIGIGSNLTVNSTSIKIGNSTVNATVNSSAIELRNGLINVSLDSADTAGSGMNIPTSIKVGNSTVNAVINSTSLGIGSNVLIGVSGFSIGNSTVNTVANSTAFSVGTGFYIAANGNVGINTSTPAGTYHPSLHLLGGNPNVRLQGNNTGAWAYLELLNTNYNRGVGMRTDGGFVISSNNQTLDANVQFFVAASGNVGIGTTGPQTRLELNDIASYSGSMYSGIKFLTISRNEPSRYNAYAGFGDWAGGNKFGWMFGTRNNNVDYNTLYMVDGNVGIGNTAPAQKLTVNGAIESLVDQYGGANEGGQLILRSPAGGNTRWNIDNYVNNFRIFKENDSDGTGGAEIITINSANSAARFLVSGAVRYGSALQAAAANKVIRGWHHYTTSGSASGTYYVHFKTNMWAGGAPNGNIQYTMSLFRATGYTYNATTIDSLLGFHNWIGNIYSIVKTNLGTQTFWENPYTSSDGYVVLVGNISNYNYLAVSIDWFQTYEYPYVNAWVTEQTVTGSATGAY